MLPNSGKPVSVLLIEDTSDHAILIQRLLDRVGDPGVGVRHVTTIAAAETCLAEEPFDLILADLKLPDSDMDETLPRIFALTDDLPVVVLTSLDDVEFAVRTMDQGAQDYLIKADLTTELLFRSIHYAIHRHQVSRELKERNEELHRFASIVAHEVRTPLQVVTTCLDIVEAKHEAAFDQSTTRFVADSRQAINNVAKLASRLLEFARVGADESEFGTVDLDRQFRDACFTIQNAYSSVELQVSCEQPLPSVHGDPLLIQQLLDNLLSNSIKYRNGETASVKARAIENDGGLRIEIEDAGIGIEPSERERVFEMFRRTKSAGDSPGSGLGLAFCKRIVEHHGGRIWIAGAKNGGSRFCFTLPKPLED
ncbi:MAG: signal transduction histidine kinase [Verrucomicrobiales bacterium]|jgi:signal transduction histidine kinase